MTQMWVKAHRKHAQRNVYGQFSLLLKHFECIEITSYLPEIRNNANDRNIY